MSLKFSANLCTLYKEVDFIDRFQRAKDAGFSAIEMENPYELAPELIKNKLDQLDLKCDLVNMYCDFDSPYGCASLPGDEVKFTAAIQRTNPYNFYLGFKKLHILSGNRCDDIDFEEQLLLFKNSLQTLLENDYLEDMLVTGVIEPISPAVNDKYFLNSFDTAVELLKSLNTDRIKLLLDIYHLHMITGDVKKYLDIYYPYAGHIQVSQDPGRREPFFSGGKIDYRYVFDTLRQKNHKDFIGLEYFPSGSTEESLAWMKDYSG